MSSPELISRGWVVLLSLSFALLTVAMLRPVCRRWLGAERTFQLWLLPPLAILASQLPHLAGAPVPPLPSLVLTLTTVANAVNSSPRSGFALRWQDVVLIVWLLGAMIGAMAAFVAQRRYQRMVRHATRMADSDGGWPIWRAKRNDVGPALIGAWRPRIVLPADFEDRYSTQERALILAHEAAHASRRDGYWSLGARALLIVGWCHPFAWWAYRAFRLDQELACDAAVMRHHGRQRQIYAQAMLKTQSAAFVLPIGCSWSPRHPITERIAMLKLSPPGKARRVVGRVALLALGVVIAGSLYAATSSQGASSTGDYRLKLELGVNGQPARLHANVCLKQGGRYETTQGGLDPLPPWQASFTVVPGPDGRLEVQADIAGGSTDKPVHPRIRMLPGQTGSIQLGEKVIGKDGVVADHTLKVDLTPSIGC
jgi:beta-lactamase regulating signal transducer with metallopeptidase domain